MRIELSRKAQADLDEIRDYSVEQFGVMRALEYLSAVEEAFRRVLAYPDSGSARFDLRDRLRTVPVGEHRIFYLAETGRVLIVRILHKRMDVGRHM